MRADTAAFAAKNVALAKRPRYVIEVAFDSANTILRYFTSHSDSALPGGASSIMGVVEGLSGTSQTLNPDTANASIGNISFSLVDKASIVTTTLGGQLALGRSTRRQRVRVYVGYEGLAWADYTLVQTQLVSEISYSEGAYKFSCADVQREMRKDLFELAKTTLAQSLSDSATTIEVFATAAFTLVAHGTSYSDAPSSTVGYLKIQDEVIRYTGKTSTQFTGCTRGALNTRAVEHPVDATAAADRRTAVEEFVYLELPAVKLVYALLTGVLHNQGGATLPASWHLGIPTSYVRLADFTDAAKSDLWNPADDEQGFVVRFEGLTKTDGKKFIETELALLCGVFMPVYADGALGLRRMANILAGAAYVRMLDDSNLVSVGDLVHDFNALHNIIQINWNWETARADFTRINLLIDSSSVTVHGRSDPLKLKFRGLHGSRHSAVILAQRFDSIRDRYTGPPFRIPVSVLPSLNTLEVGDVVRLRPAGVRDFVVTGGGALDRSYEIQNISIDWITGNVGLKLVASSRAPDAVAATADATVLTQAWYTGTGTALASVLTITGSNPGHVTAGGTLTGNADMNAAGAIFYYDGDLQIDAGVTVNLVNNVQLRVRGFLQNNGTLNGVGGGLAGGAAVGSPTTMFDFNPGVVGFIGTTEAGGIALEDHARANPQGFRGASTVGRSSTVPSFTLAWSGTTLNGTPGDLRGSSGASGGVALWEEGSQHEPQEIVGGSAGGAGGAGLLLVTRGFDTGASGKIDLSGGNSTLAGFIVVPLAGDDLNMYAGSGGGGAPGGLLILLDGATASATGLGESELVANYGLTPVPFNPREFPYYVGTGDGTTFPLPSLSGARGGSRVQYVPGNTAATADLPAATLTAPTNIGLASGTSELLRQGDGTLVPRIKVTWTPSVDARTAGYDIQSKETSEPATSYRSIAPALGQAAAVAWITGVRDGIAHDVRIRAAGATREVSDWVEVTNYIVLGKTEKPSNVGTLQFTDPFLSWTAITDGDRRGYIVRYQHGSNTDWASALPAHKEGFFTPTRFDTGDIVGGIVTLLVKSIDTTGNESLTAASLEVDLRPPTPDSFFIARQPDGTREFTFALNAPPADLAGFHLRYYLGSTSDWSAMTALHTGELPASPFETNQLAAGTYTFALKSVDRAKNESAAASFITSVTIGDPRIAGAVEDITEQPTWTGTRSGCGLDGATGWLVADNTATWADLPSTWAAWTSWIHTPTSPITYTRSIDIGAKIKFVPLVTVTGDGTITIEERHGDNGVDYSSYATVGPQVDARYIDIRVTSTGTFPKLKTMRTILSAALTQELLEDVVTSALTGSYDLGVGNVRLPITKPFTVIKSVKVTLQNVGGGWSWELIDKNTSVGPQIKIYNNTPSLADATIDADIQGLT